MKLLVRYTSILALLALALLPAAALAAPAPGTVLPPTGTSGTRFVFLADGFVRNERLSSWANTPDGRVLALDTGAPARATSDGSVSWNWVAPSGFQGGTWQFVVHGLSSGVERVFSFGVGTAVPASDQAPQYNVQPAVGKPGDVFRFYATGFEDGEPVDTSVLAPDGRAVSGGLQAMGYAQSGRIDGTWVAPTDQPAYGAWRFVLRGRESKVERTIPFTLEPSTPQAQATMRVSPEVGRPGLLFLFSAKGLKPGEDLSVWLNTPGGQIVALDPSDLRPAADDGSANWSWTAPANAAPGFYSMVVHGRKSGLEQVAAFQILPA